MTKTVTKRRALSIGAAKSPMRRRSVSKRMVNCQLHSTTCEPVCSLSSVAGGTLATFPMKGRWSTFMLWSKEYGRLLPAVVLTVDNNPHATGLDFGEA